MVYQAGVGPATEIAVSPGYGQSGAPYGSAVADYFHYIPVDDAGDTISGYQSQFDYALIHLSRPFTTGAMGLEANFGGGAANVTGYPGSAGGAQVNVPQVVTPDPYYTLFDGTALGLGSSGGPVWITDANGPEVVGLVSSEYGSAGYDVQITSSAYDQIESWVAQDASSVGTGLAVLDTSTDQVLPSAVTPYAGPVAGLQEQFIDITSDNLNVAASTDNWFIHTGSGTDAIAVTGGTNVLDGGTGSNFLVGGSGTDTFFVDDRQANADIWSSVSNFHTGDSATVWGVTPSAFALIWADGQGASGYTGLTLHAEAADRPTASLTLAGYTSADLSNGTLSVAYGTDAASGSAYMYIHANA